MKMIMTFSKMAHKADLSVGSTLRNFLSPQGKLILLKGVFGAIYLFIYTDLVFSPIDKVVDLM